MIKSNKEVLEWFERCLDGVKYGKVPYVYLVVDFDQDEYYKIKSHEEYHSYSLFDLMTQYNLSLWGGTPVLSEAKEDWNKTINTIIGGRRVVFRNNNHRIAILKMTKEDFILVQFIDL